MSQLTVCLIICMFVIGGYIWGKFPMGLIATVGSIAFLLTGCIDTNTLLGNFSNSNLVMMLAMFVVAAGFNKTQFVKKIASSVNKIGKGSSTLVITGYIAVAIVLSQFIQSPMVVISIVAPMLAVSCDELNLSHSKVMFSLGIAAIVTCSTLPLGAGATVFAELNGYLEANQYTTYMLSITDPMKARFPLLIVTALYCIFIAPKLAPQTPSVVIDSINQKSKKECANLSPFQEKAGYIVFLLTSLCLLLQQQIGQPAWLICMVGAVCMNLSGVLSEKETFQAVPWWMGFLFAGSLNMAAALTSTGAGNVIGNMLANIANGLGNPYLIGFMFFIVPFLLTQVMSNRAVMTIFIPIAILAFKSMGANPVGIVILIQAACLTAFMTPMATGAVPAFMAYGGYDIKDVLRQSIIPAVIFCMVSVFWIMTVFPMYG